MTIEPIYTISFVAISLLFTYLFLKRSGKKGCMTFGYVFLVILSINLFTIFSSAFMYFTLQDAYSSMVSGENYTATVVSIKEDGYYEHEDGTTEPTFKPTVQFATNQGNLVTKELNHTSTGIEIGETYTINYHAETGEVITLGFTLAIQLAGAFLFSIIFSFLFIGMLLYIFQKDMTAYKSFAKKTAFYFFIPFIMIGFNALLIYGMIYGNDVPVWVTALLGFFVLGLSLGTIGYFKMIFKKGTPIMKRVSSNRWEADWEN